MVADEMDFLHRRHRIEIYGLCPECRRRDLTALRPVEGDHERHGRIGSRRGLRGRAAEFPLACVLPLVPSYLGFVTGFTMEEMSGRRRLAMVHSLLFVLGFSLIFILLGAGATASAGCSITTRSG